ncbi:MAG: DMT family transporter [Candidatus Micrarchaeales archaeon]|nr:DMT family transporter [Candidatus Micrarchaeales archaeon]
MILIGIVIALLSLLTYSIADGLSKYPSRIIGHNRTAVIVLAAGTLASLSMFAVPQLIGTITPAVIALSVFAGFLEGAWFLWVFKSLETEQVGNTMALVDVPYAIIVLFGILVLIEPITSIEIVGVIGIFAGVALVMSKDHFKFNKRLIPALAGNIVLGFFYVAFISAVTLSGGIAIPATVAKLVAFAIILADTLLFYKPRKHTGIYKPLNLKSLPFLAAILVGVLDAAGAIGVAAYSLLGIVVLGGAIVAIEPAIVMLFGFKFYKERFTTFQILGFVIIVAGAILLNIA